MQPDYNQFVKEKKAHSWVFWAIIAAVFILIAGLVAFFFIVLLPNINEETKVKDELITQNLRLKANSIDGVLDASAIANVQDTERATVKLVVSSDQKSYCLQAKSVIKPDEITYHMIQSTPDQKPVTGECGDGATEPPARPENITLGSVGGGSVSLVWNGATEAKEYTAECSKTDAFTSPIKSAKSSTATITVEALEENSDYFCRVNAQNSKGASGWSETVKIKTGGIARVPQNLKIQTISSTSLSYEWQAVRGATQYVFEYSTDASFMKDVIQVRTSQTSGKLDNLQVYTGYFFHVKAITPTYNESAAPFSPIVQGRTNES